VTDIARMAAENPFPAQAVMTFGPLPRISVELKFMTDAFEPVRQYLINYSRANLRSTPEDRTALGLTGEHGSGKTFLLTWLRDEIGRIENLSSRIAYAKADTSLFVDIYRQLLRNFTQSMMLEVVATALRRIAVRRTGGAFATESRSEEIGSGASLEAAYDEKILDRNELYIELKNRISEAGPAGVARTVAEVVGLLENPDLGRSAFDWLCGADPGETSLPVTAPLLPAPTGELVSDAADIAVSALACIAKLFAIAEMPLVLMVDQVENFATSDVSVTFWSSIIKKLAEQVRQQNGLVVFAGTRAAWDRVPRDVGPRLIGREPLPVGNLELAEVGLLLDAYHSGTPRFPATAVDAIHRLSGGNPREVLQIAHLCWRDTGGHLGDVDEAAVLRAAGDGGTLTDRAKLAMADIDRVLERMGLLGREFRLPDGTLIDRLASGSGSAQPVAIVLALATDPVHEVTAAQRMIRIREMLEAMPGKPPLLVIPIGYRSESVERLVKSIFRVEPFGGRDFEVRFQSTLSQIIAEHPQSGKDTSSILNNLFFRIETLQDNLKNLEKMRTEEADTTARRLAEGSEKLNAPERQEREKRTRWDLVDGLEEVRSALDHDGLDEEQSILRSLLVANELNVHNNAFDHLGILYMDALDLERSLLRSARLRAEKPGIAEVALQIRNLRAQIIGLARRSVIRGRQTNFVLPSAAAGLVGLSMVALLGDKIRYMTVQQVTIVIPVAVGLAVLGGLVGWWCERLFKLQMIYSSVARRMHWLRAQVARIGGVTAE
jgi:hypothetical protein